MSNKRILCIIESLGSGGAERQLCGLASMLTSRGFQCRLITYAPGDFYEKFLHDNNVDYEYVPALLNARTRVWRLLKYLYEYKPTTVISFLPSVNKTCCLARLIYKCNLIVSERNNTTHINRSDRILFNLYRMANHIVPNSYSQGNFILENFPFLTNKISPIINFVDTNKFSPPERKSFSPDIRFITVARYGAQKNCLLFLDAVKKIKEKGLNVKFKWFGCKNFDREYAKIVEQKVGELEIADYISINDANQDIVNEYRNSDIFILPSLYEGYPNVIVEAMSCELPILCSRVFENPFIVEEGVNGFLFDPRSVDDIISAIQNVVSLSEDERLAIGKSNRQLCLQRNTEAVFLENYLKLIGDDILQ